MPYSAIIPGRRAAKKPRSNAHEIHRESATCWKQAKRLTKIAGCSFIGHATTEDCLEALEDLKNPQEFEADCAFSRIKRQIILGRRRSDGWDYEGFLKDVEGNLDDICAHFSTRWLVSLTDTYADYGLPIERSNASIIALLVNWEKLARTDRLLHEPRARPPEDLTRYCTPQPLWDGVTSLVMDERADMIKNLFARVREQMAETPILSRILKTVLERASKEPEFTLARLGRLHPRPLMNDALGLQAPEDI